MKLPIRYYGDPVLREIAKPIEKITDEIRELAANMVETMHAANNGIGLAANQVGVLLRIFVSIVDYEDNHGELHYRAPRAIINPVLSEPSNALIECGEGCISFPKLYLPIARPRTIILDAIDIEGNPIHEECVGYVARHMMHETDHLNGVLFVDRVKGKRRNEIEPVLRQIKLKYYKPTP